MQMVNVSGKDCGEYRHAGSKGLASKVRKLLEEVGIQGDFYICVLGNINVREFRGMDMDGRWALLPGDLMPNVICLGTAEGVKASKILLWSETKGVRLAQVREAIEKHESVVTDNERLNFEKRQSRMNNELYRRAVDNACCHAILHEVAVSGCLDWSRDELSELCRSAISDVGEVPLAPQDYQRMYFQERGESGRYVMNETMWSRLRGLTEGYSPALMVDLVALQVIYTGRAVMMQQTAKQNAEQFQQEAERLEKEKSRYASLRAEIAGKIAGLREQITALEAELQEAAQAESDLRQQVNDQLSKGADEDMRATVIGSILRSPEAKMFCDVIAEQIREQQEVAATS